MCGGAEMASKAPMHRQGSNLRNAKSHAADLRRKHNTRKPGQLDWAWRRFRAWLLKQRPVCEAEGCNRPATELHHVKPRDTHPELRLDPENIQALCKSHHSSLTMTDTRRK